MDRELRKTDAAEPLIVDDAFDFELFRAKHQRNLIIGVIALVVIVFGSAAWITVTHYQRLAAEALFSGATDITGWQQVIDKYPHSEPAADAYFLVAAGLRDAGKVDDSTAMYHKFLDAFPNHALDSGAWVGIGQNQDLQGKPQDALTSYVTAHAQFPKSYAAPFALLSQAGILIRQSKMDEARRVLTDLVAEYQDSTVSQMAQSQLERLEAATGK